MDIEKNIFMVCGIKGNLPETVEKLQQKPKRILQIFMPIKIYLVIKLNEKDLVSVPLSLSFLRALCPLTLCPGLMCQHSVV